MKEQAYKREGREKAAAHGWGHTGEKPQVRRKAQVRELACVCKEEKSMHEGEKQRHRILIAKGKHMQGRGKACERWKA